MRGGVAVVGELGRVHEVSVEEFGSILTADHAATVTTLTVKSAVDFDEQGGTLAYIDPADTAGTDVIAVAYTACDKDANTITLAAGLPDALDRDTFLTVVGGTDETELWAQVMIEDEDEPASVRVPHHLRSQLPEGVREPDLREAVEVDEDPGGEQVIVEILGLPPTVETISSPATGAAPSTAEIRLRSGATFGDSSISLDAGETATSGDLTAAGTFWASQATILGFDGEAFTGVRFGRRSANTDGSGLITVTHGFEVIPAYVLLTNDTFTFRSLSVGTRTATTFEVRVRTHDGSLMTGTATEFFWLAFTTT
jgi:hypothetical protein